MDRWKMYMAGTEADRRRAEAQRQREEQQLPAPSPEPGESWFEDCEPFPRAT